MIKQRSKYLNDCADEDILVDTGTGACVLEIADYKTYDSKEKAELWVAQLFESVKRLEDFPRSGRVVLELRRDEIREVFFERYRVVYKIESEKVEILTVRHMREQLGGADLDE